MVEARSPLGSEKEKKRRKRVMQYARCPHCWCRVAVPDDKDPDQIVISHAKNGCWWVEKYGFFVHPSMKVEAG